MPINEVILTTDNCRYCLMCRHVCPVEHVTRLETLSPHGWGLTIASVRRGLLSWDEDTVDVLYKCADCGTCRANCVTDQPLPDAIAAARAWIFENGLAPESVRTVVQALETWENPYKEQKPAPVSGADEVAFFVGDEAFYLWPDTIDAVLSLLDTVGIQPILIGQGRNNGYLPSSLGAVETARNLAATTIKELISSGVTQLLVLSPGDYYTFTQLYSDRLDIQWPDHVAVQEVLPLLAEHYSTGRLQFSSINGEHQIAYVDPTHTVRNLTRCDAPRQLLSAVLPNGFHELFWRRERAHPAGNTALQFTNPHIASHLAYARLDDARQKSAEVLISDDPGTLNYLNQFADRFGVQIRSLFRLLTDHVA